MRHYLFATIVALAMTPAVASAQSAPAATCSRPYTAAKTSVETLMADPGAMAIFKKDLPELAATEEIKMAGSMTLKDVQGFAPDKITDAMLAAMDADLAKLPAC